MKYISRVTLYCLALLCAIAPGLGHGQEFPTKPIRLIIPTAPGGGTDIAGRVLAGAMQSMGVTVYVENKGGAGGTLGMAMVARATPDGYTLGFAYMDPITVMPQLMSAGELGYNAEKDFLPIAQVGDTNYAFAVSSKLPVNSISELVALAKTKPGQLNFATQGRGSTGHLIMKLLEQRTGTEFTDVPYKGAGPAMMALMSDEAQIIATSPISLKPVLAGGRLKALAVAGDKRSPMLPDTPTMAESGYPGFAIYSWWGVFAPAGVPDAVAEKLTELILAAARSPEMAERMLAIGGNLNPRGRVDFEKFLRGEAALWKKVVTDGKVKLKD